MKKMKEFLSWWFWGKPSDEKLYIWFGVIFFSNWFSSPWSWIIIGLGASSFLPFLAVALYKDLTKNVSW